MNTTAPNSKGQYERAKILDLVLSYCLVNAIAPADPVTNKAHETAIMGMIVSTFTTAQHEDILVELLKSHNEAIMAAMYIHTAQ